MIPWHAHRHRDARNADVDAPLFLARLAAVTAHMSLMRGGSVLLRVCVCVGVRDYCCLPSYNEPSLSSRYDTSSAIPTDIGIATITLSC